MIGNTAGELAGFLQVREPQPPADEATKGIISFTSKHQRMSLGLNLKPSRFVCKKAAMPPKVLNPQTFQNEPRGYMVLEKSSCHGSVFQSKCFCWDSFRLLAGQDPLTTELDCNPQCDAGPCDGRTCGTTPPAAVTRKPPQMDNRPPMPPARQTEEVMVPEDEAIAIKVQADPT
jgi:hypothetical protein